MLEKFHIHWASVTFSKRILTRMTYMMKEKTKFVNTCNIEVNCVNRNGENVVTTNLSLIHFFIIQNCKNWVQKQTSYVILVKRCPNCPGNAILHICHLTYQNNYESSLPMNIKT
jgi:hypothetical protein